MGKRFGAGLIATILLVLPACAGGSSGGSDTGKQLVIGYAAALSGDGAVGDVPGLAGAQYEVSLLNKSGGIDGHPVKLIAKDMQSDPELGGTVAQELLDQGAAIILGPPFPSMAVGVIQTAAKANVTVLSVTSTQPEFPVVGGAKAYLTAFGDNVQAAAAAQYALEQGYKSVLTVVSPDLSYTSETPKWFVDAFQHGGGTSAGSVQFTIGQQDLSPQVTQIASMNPQPDVIYTTMFMPDIGTFMKQLRGAGVTTPIIGADGFDDLSILQFAGTDAEGTAFTTHGFATSGSAFEEFIKGMTAANGKAPEAPALTALGASSIQLVAAAVDAAGSMDPTAIGNALADLSKVDVVTGTISFQGTNGVPLKTVTIAAMEGGDFVFKEAFIPDYIPKP
jgi:branched-chain amino acid transport system substrate-binding protein